MVDALLQMEITQDKLPTITTETNISLIPDQDNDTHIPSWTNSDGHSIITTLLMSQLWINTHQAQEVRWQDNHSTWSAKTSVGQSTEKTKSNSKILMLTLSKQLTIYTRTKLISSMSKTTASETICRVPLLHTNCIRWNSNSRLTFGKVTWKTTSKWRFSTTNSPEIWTSILFQENLIQIIHLAIK